ncbi:peptidase P60 [Bacillus wiedmannii]|uniref:lysozyme family protein n=2 Tax=Bacillus wiedmannii TaxID=1890302 RepID=UPI000BFC1329|nr:lysozyme family protein [Bacillus wiedmannii]PHD19333.1 peptidase P60 [Bacillus wiedmannii]
MNKLVASPKTVNLPQQVLRWQTMVENECAAQGVPELVPYVLGIIMVESGGNAEETPDIMQSSESQGRPMNSIDNPKESIYYGVMHLKGSFADAKKYGITDLSAIVQTYNFGRAYIRWLASNNKQHSLPVADQYSKTVVAPSLGNNTGAMVRYSHPIAVAYNGGYRYKNGGNFFYAEIVKQYVDFNGGTDPTDVDTRQNVTLPSDWQTKMIGTITVTVPGAPVLTKPDVNSAWVGRVPKNSGHAFLGWYHDGAHFWYEIAENNWIREDVCVINDDGKRSKGGIYVNAANVKIHEGANTNDKVVGNVSWALLDVDNRYNDWLHITAPWGWIKKEDYVKWVR